MEQLLIKRLIKAEDLVVPTLFKPVQFNILKKLNLGEKLNENEKRYLRGKMKLKLNILNKLIPIKQQEINEYNIFLGSIESYYITGLEALKHNGYGWYFDTKSIEVINTKIQGKIRIENKTLKLIRVKSITNSNYKVDKETGLKYATNEQVFKDTKITKNTYTKLMWIQLVSRYKKIFVKNYKKYNMPLENLKINYSKYGV